MNIKNTYVTRKFVTYWKNAKTVFVQRCGSAVYVSDGFQMVRCPADWWSEIFQPCLMISEPESGACFSMDSSRSGIDLKKMWDEYASSVDVAIDSKATVMIHRKLSVHVFAHAGEPIIVNQSFLDCYKPAVSVHATGRNKQLSPLLFNVDDCFSFLLLPIRPRCANDVVKAIAAAV